VSNKIYKWNVNLAWELFSSSVYSYRKAIESTMEHQKHMYYKNGLLSAVTSVEAYINEILRNEYSWSNTKFKKNQNINTKLEVLDIDINLYSTSKNIRNDFIIHHKEKDHSYFDIISKETLLQAIESAQEIISIIHFKRKEMFPYWITGVNFINPSSNNDICLSHNIEFWRHIEYLKILPFRIYESSGNLDYKIENYTHYKSLYYELWQKIKDDNFEFKFYKNEKFPLMPILSCKFWDE